MKERDDTYHIPVINIAWLKSKLEKLNKRAIKLDLEPVTIEVIRQYERTDKTEGGYEYQQPMNEILIHGVSPKINGWSFLGSIEHTDHGNIVRLSREFNIPEDFRTVKKACSHCNKQRNRKDTYLVVSENGEFKQLGKSCLKDYTGHMSLKWLGQLAQFIHEIEKSEREPIEYDGWARQEIPADMFLRTACEAVIASGGAYITRKQATGDDDFCTSQYAWMSLFPPPNMKDFRPVGHTDAGEKLYNAVAKTLNELKGQDLNDFQFNVMVTWNKETIERRNAGILAAGILIYEKDLIQKLEIAKDADSKWVGEIKKRQDFMATITKIRGYETQFGYMSVIIMKDSDGNVMVWKTSTGFEIVDERGFITSPEVGDTVSFKGTVKDHSTYNGIKQTLVNRCKLLEEKKVPKIA